MYRSVLAILLAYVELWLQTRMEIAMLPVSQGLHLRGALALLLALPVPSALSAGAALAQTKIITGMVAHGPPQWPQYIATELGWFQQDNIELDFVTAGGSGAQQLAAGALDICHSGYPDFARASLQGAPVKIIINDIVASPSGFSNLGDTKPYAEDIPFTVWAANMPWAEKNRNALTAFARNYKRGVRWLYDAANKDRAIDILMKYARQARKDLEEAYDYQVTKLKLYGLDGDVSDKTYEKMAEGLAEIDFIKKPFPPKSAIFDGSFVQQATN